jgi:hypothetical protein
MVFQIHENKHSEKVVHFTAHLENYCSKNYVKRILKAHRNGMLWSLYFTPSKRIKAIFIP